MEISIAAEKLFSIGSFPVTNAFLIGFLETVFEGLLSLIESVLGNKAQSRRALPLIATIFLFVLVSNWVGLFPGAGTIGLSHIKDGHATIIPFLRSTSADLNFTIALSLMAVLTIQVSGIAALGIVKYAKKFFVSPLRKPYG